MVAYDLLKVSFTLFANGDVGLGTGLVGVFEDIFFIAL